MVLIGSLSWNREKRSDIRFSAKNASRGYFIAAFFLDESLNFFSKLFDLLWLQVSHYLDGIGLPTHFSV
jgi:hypothetical protein